MAISGNKSGLSSFQTYIGGDELSVKVDGLGRLLIDLKNTQHTLVRRKAISKVEEVRKITG